MTTPRPQLTRDIEIDDTPKNGAKLSGSMMGYVVMVVIALVVSFAIVYFFGVSKAGVETFKTETTAKIDSMSSDLRASTSSIKTGLDSITGLVDKKVTDSVSSINSRMSDLETANASIKDQSNTATSQANQAINKTGTLEKSLADLQSSIKSVTDLQGSITTLNTWYQTLKTNYDTLNSNYNVLKTNYDSLKTNYDALKAQVDAINTTTTPTTTPTGITLVVSNPSLPLTFVSGYTNTVNITISNNTAKGLYGGYVAIPIQLIGTLPTGESINTVLPVTALTSSSLNWRPITYVSPVAISVIGDFTGYISGNSSIVVTISVHAVTASTGNLLLNIGTPTFSGFTSY